MKFDVVIGNPPYQEDIEGENESYAAPLYPDFMDSAYDIGRKVLLITPARFLFNAGATKSKWNKKMLSDEHLAVVHYEKDSRNVFNNVGITGGVAITYRDEDAKLGPIDTFIPYSQLKSIVSKVSNDHFESMSDGISNQYRYNLDTLYADYPDLKNVIGSKGRDKRMRANAFDGLPIFTDVKENDDDIRVLGVRGKNRIYRYVPKKYVSIENRLTQYEVYFPGVGGSGLFGDKLSPYVIGSPYEGHTQTFLSLGSFDTKMEAGNCGKYIKTKFLRSLLGILKVTPQNAPATFRFIPLQDFTKDSDIDWSKSIAEIDQELYEKYGLSEEEITFIETHVKEME